MKVHVDRHRCIGSGQCTSIAPVVFDQGDDDGIVVLLAAEPPADEHAAARKAAHLCPARAIGITED